MGSGTRNLYKYSNAYTGTEPELVDGDVFEAHVTVESPGSVERDNPVSAPMANVDQVIRALLDSRGSVTASSVAAVARVSARTALRHLSKAVEAGELVAIGATSSREYRRA
ncbi:hypothetical protein [Curtanaerobium respiraculi]|uniref:hypothetical protein n=1 Tax=Curtanaerobium respiraculi TaxID=2949669 RepID=UPI0024B33EAA|nr:hypothetical protein [Curtanaerobium respiraculi]